MNMRKLQRIAFVLVHVLIFMGVAIVVFQYF
jgi:hypothetical protein